MFTLHNQRAMSNKHTGQWSLVTEHKTTENRSE